MEGWNERQLVCPRSLYVEVLVPLILSCSIWLAHPLAGPPLGIASLLFLEIVYYLGTNLSNFEKFVILNFGYPFGSHSVVCRSVVWTRDIIELIY